MVEHPSATVLQLFVGSGICAVTAASEQKLKLSYNLLYIKYLF